MTRKELRAYVEDPARVVDRLSRAVRELLAEHDDYRKKLAQFLDDYPAFAALKEDAEIAQAHARSLARENKRLREVISQLHPDPWETEQ